MSWRIWVRGTSKAQYFGRSGRNVSRPAMVVRFRGSCSSCLERRRGYVVSHCSRSVAQSSARSSRGGASTKPQTTTGYAQNYCGPRPPKESMSISPPNFSTSPLFCWEILFRDATFLGRGLVFWEWDSLGVRGTTIILGISCSCLRLYVGSTSTISGKQLELEDGFRVIERALPIGEFFDVYTFSIRSRDMVPGVFATRAKPGEDKSAFLWQGEVRRSRVLSTARRLHDSTTHEISTTTTARQQGFFG